MKNGKRQKSVGQWPTSPDPRSSVFFRVSSVFNPWLPLFAFDLHLSRLDLLDLGQVHRQHAVLALGRNPRGVDRLVDLEDAEVVAFLVLSEQRLARTLL